MTKTLSGGWIDSVSGWEPLIKNVFQSALNPSIFKATKWKHATQPSYLHDVVQKGLRLQNVDCSQEAHNGVHHVQEIFWQAEWWPASQKWLLHEAIYSFKFYLIKPNKHKHTIKHQRYASHKIQK